MKAYLVLLLVLSATCYQAFEADFPESDPVTDFLEGFLEGLNQKGDIKKLLECVKGAQHIIDEILEAIELIKKGDPANILAGVMKLVQAVTELMNMLQPCMKGFEQLQKLFEKLKHINFQKLLFKILANLSFYMGKITDAIDAFGKGDYKRAGKDIGQVLYSLFLTETNDEFDFSDFSFEDFIKILEGFLAGINQHQIFDDTIKCIGDMPTIVQLLKDLFEMIKNMHWDNIEELVAAMLKLLEATKGVLRAIIPCSKAPAEIINLIKKIIDLNGSKILENFLKHFASVLADVTASIGHIKAKEWHNFGMDLGDIFFVILLV